jgi:hypothetical protein
MRMDICSRLASRAQEGGRFIVRRKDLAMRKTLSGLIAAGIISAFAMPAFAQTTTPTGPSDCKTNETWDATTKTCKQKM